MEEIASLRLEHRVAGSPPTLVVAGAWDWNRFLAPEANAILAAILHQGIVRQRWFGAKAKTIEAIDILDAIPIAADAQLLLAQIHFSAGAPEVYQFSLGFALGEEAQRLLDESLAVWACVELDDRQPAVLFDAIHDPAFCAALLDLVATNASRRGNAGELTAWQTDSFNDITGPSRQSLTPRLLTFEQSNNSIVFGDRVILKLFRRVEMGVNPDLEMNAYLAKKGFAHVPALAGAVEYRSSSQATSTLALLQRFVPNQGDAWRAMLQKLDGFFERMIGLYGTAAEVLQLPEDGLCQAANRPIPSAIAKAVADFLPAIEMLAVRTGEMHLTLAATDEPTFAPEPLNEPEQRAFYEKSRQLADEVFALLRRQLPSLPHAIQTRARQVLDLESAAKGQLRRLMSMTIHAAQIRCHGDYHLGQVLVVGDDFMIIDFEGEPARPLDERRKKQLALRDVAGMIRSYHYASCSAATRAKVAMPDADAAIDTWSQAWYFWVSAAFLAAYRRTVGEAAFVPTAEDEFACLIEACLLEKALYELRYELNNRPDWVYLPLEALVALVKN